MEKQKLKLDGGVNKSHGSNKLMSAVREKRSPGEVVVKKKSEAVTGISTNLTYVRDQLWQRPGFLLRRCLQLTSGVFEQSCSEIGLTARQYDYLFVLDIIDEVGQTELASLVGLDKATNTLVVQILERKQWIKRVVSSQDSRKKVVRITDQGRYVFQSAKVAADKAIDSIGSALTKQEYSQLLKLMQKVALNRDYRISDQIGSSTDPSFLK